MSVRVSRDEAWSLLSEWVESESLRRHCLGVEAAMRAYARKGGEDEELWGVVGLLHDMDYERFPDMDDAESRPPADDHGRARAPRRAAGDGPRRSPSHADFLGVSRETPMEHTLYAVDELSGFIVACAYVRPEGIHGLTPKSVKKKLKQPSPSRRPSTATRSATAPRSSASTSTSTSRSSSPRSRSARTSSGSTARRPRSAPRRAPAAPASSSSSAQMNGEWSASISVTVTHGLSAIMRRCSAIGMARSSVQAM